MKYAFIREHNAQFQLKTLCHLLGVSRGGYYGWLGQVGRNQHHQQQKAEFDQEVARSVQDITITDSPSRKAQQCP